MQDDCLALYNSSTIVGDNRGVYVTAVINGDEDKDQFP